MADGISASVQLLISRTVEALRTAIIMIKHVVLLKFSEAATTERRAELAAAFAGLATQVPEILSLEWGLNVSPEGLDKGFTHCFVVTFHDEAARDAYLPHPAHLAFVQEVKPWLADVLVVDCAVS